jgi:hypothetical protein
MLDMGTELARVSGDGPPALRIVGIQEGMNPKYVGQVMPFGANSSYSAQELAMLYGAVDAEIVLKTEQESWRELSAREVHKKNLKRIDLAAEQEALPTPEQVFARIAAEAA